MNEPQQIQKLLNAIPDKERYHRFFAERNGLHSGVFKSEKARIESLLAVLESVSALDAHDQHPTKALGVVFCALGELISETEETVLALPMVDPDVVILLLRCRQKHLKLTRPEGFMDEPPEANATK